MVSVNIRQEGQRTSEGIVKEFKSGFGAKPIIALRETELCNKPLRASGYVGFFHEAGDPAAHLVPCEFQGPFRLHASDEHTCFAVFDRSGGRSFSIARRLGFKICTPSRSISCL